jgi:hypothetical protein
MEFQEIIEAIDDGTLEPTVGGIFVDSLGGNNPVYVADVGEFKLQFINSSNQRTLHDFDSLLGEISERLAEDEDEGEVFDAMTGNQIFFEVVGIDEAGSLLK